MRSVFTVLVLSLFMVACTWVELNPKGEGVRVITASEAQGCKPVGKAHAQVLDTAAGFKRSAEKMALELETIARNTAAEIGGNAIMPTSPIQEGKRDYQVFLCGMAPAN